MFETGKLKGNSPTKSPKKVEPLQLEHKWVKQIIHRIGPCPIWNEK